MPNFEQERLSALRQDLGATQRAGSTRSRQRPLLAPDARDPDSGSVGFFGDNPGQVVFDLALAAPRGIEEFGRDLVGAFNIVPGIDFELDDERILGRARTGVGELSTGLFNFAAGFVPIAGAVGRFGRLGKVLDLTRRSERALRAGKRTRAALATRVGRDFAAGAATDFLAFDGNEARLSNMLTTVPALRNPVFEFLAADEEDPEAVGRIKNVLEGFGVGGMVDLFLGSLRALRAQRKLRTPGKSAEQVLEERESFVSGKKILEDAERARESIRQSRDEGASGAAERPTEADPQARAQAQDETRARTAARAFQEIRDAAQISDDELRQLVADMDERRRQGPRIPGDPFLNPRSLTTAQRAFLGLSERDRNLSKLVMENGPGYLLRLSDQITGEKPRGNPGAFESQSLVQQTAEGVNLVADAVDATPEGLMLAILEDEQDLRTAARKTLGYRTILTSLSREAYESGLLEAQRQGLSDESLVRFKEKLAPLIMTSRALARLEGRLGEGLGALRQPLAEVKEGAEIARSISESGSAEALRRNFMKIKAAFESHDDPLAQMAAMRKIAELGFFERGILITNEALIQSMLSGLRTQSVNLIGPTMVGMYLPLENMVGGAATLNTDVIRRSAFELTTLVSGVTESLRMAYRALRGGDNIFLPNSTVRDDPLRNSRVVRAETFGADKASLAGQAIDFLGRAIQIPTSLIRTSDEFNKQMFGRALARGELMLTGLKKSLGPEDLAVHIEEGMERLVRDGQLLTQDRLVKEALQEAKADGTRDPVVLSNRVQSYIDDFQENGGRELFSIADKVKTRVEDVTGTTPLKRGTISGDIANFIDSHPIFRPFLPFIRTPVALGRFAAQRFDVAGVGQVVLKADFGRNAQALENSRFRFAQEIGSGDANKRAAAVGRLTTGLGILGWATYLASDNRITGRGPSDKEQRRILEQAGWLPYSFRTDDGYVQFLRMDPFATLLGTVADLYQTTRMAHYQDNPAIANVGIGIALGIANNLTQKTYLSGIRNLVDALSQPERRFESIVAQYAGSVVPNTFPQALTAFGDETLRDVNGLIDKLHSRTPGLSADLPPLRNVLGEPITRATSLGAEPNSPTAIFDLIVPIAYRNVSDDLIDQEFGRLQYGYAPPKKIRHGIDLIGIRAGRTNAYDRWLQLHGQVKIAGRTLRQELRKMIRSSIYQGMVPTSTADLTSPRVSALSNIIQDFRQEAYNQLLRELPALDRQEREVVRQRRRALAGFRAESQTSITPTGVNLFPGQ